MNELAAPLQKARRDFVYLMMRQS